MTRKTQLASRVCLVVAMVLLGATATPGAEKHTTDTLDTVKKAVAEKKAILVDVREQSEWDEGHLKDAKALPLSKLQSRPKAEDLARDLPRGKVLYLHCASGRRCLKAAEMLKKYGYDVRALKAGYADLMDAGFTKAK